MSDLIAFYGARLDDDERIAKALITTWTVSLAPRIQEYADQFGPARMLREVAAKRAIMGLHQPTSPHPEFGFTYPAAAKFCRSDGPGDNWQAEYEPDHFPDALWPCWTVRYLVAVYSDHPDYDPAWAVTVG